MKISTVKYIENYKLNICFVDGTEKIVDFENFLINAKNPMTKSIMDIKNFKKVTIDTGFLSWNKGNVEISGLSIYNQ